MDRNTAVILVGVGLLTTMVLAGAIGWTAAQVSMHGTVGAMEHGTATSATAMDDHQGHSPYAGQFSSTDSIRALSSDEVSQIRGGEGAGLAKAAELNGVPGPRHVLDLAADLGLSAEQKAEVQALYDRMHATAIAAGTVYLAAQEALEADFRGGRLTTEALQVRVADVAGLRGGLEGVHLSAHLATAAALSADQVARYNVLRGY